MHNLLVAQLPLQSSLPVTPLHPFPPYDAACIHLGEGGGGDEGEGDEKEDEGGDEKEDEEEDEDKGG